MSFSEWKPYKLGDIAEVVGGGTPSTTKADFWGEEYPWLTPRDLSNYTQRFISRGERNITELGLKNSSAKLVPEGTVLLTSRAPIGYLAIALNEVCTNQGFKSFIVDEKKASNEFLFYLLKQNVEVLKQLGTGTTFAEISATTLRGLEFSFPDLKTQQRIASILSSLDDAIELNQQINKTLEEMAKAIFKEWFVDFNFPNATGKFQETEIGKIPVGWKVATFEDVFDADRGLSYKGAGLAESDAIPMHNLNSVLEGGGYKTIGIKYYNGEYKDKHIVNAGEVIVANTEQGHKYMLIGYPAIVPQFYGEYGIFSHHIYRIRPKANCYLSPDFIFHLLLQPQVRDQVVGFANGTTVNMLKNEGLKKPKFAMPPKEIAEKFGAIAKANRLQAEQNIEENQSLINLRDSLLPKLMKGEININL
ncbi:MAG: restriction endonuclease subunit S [Bacteroidia bacterium]|nr:restriction endonuclease subunit S [Bacteroidia bacterium]MCF8446560.1 restriction endonuclease subunit S [Bacteroidia bacterium]